MAKSYIKVDSTNLKEMLKRFEQVTGKSMPQIVRSHARICAVELANRTQLFSVGGGGGKAKLDEYKGYLRKDILKAVKDTDALNEKAAGIADAGLRARLQAVIASGDQRGIAAMLKAVGTIADVSNFKPVSGPAGIKAVHAPNRSKRTGRALSTRPDYHFSKGGITSYINQVSKKLGYSKSGWAECARKIGGIKGDGARGIPAWAKRHKGNNFKVTDNSERKSDSHFTMTNTTPWVSRLLSKGDQAEAVDNAKKRMIKAMNKVFSYVAKNGKEVESITAAAVAQAE